MSDQAVNEEHAVTKSNNAARSVIEALRKDDAPEIIYAGNTLSPDAMNRMMKRLEGKSIYNVGGRYTAMTNIGLLPMAVAGIDIRELVKGARDMQIRVYEESADENIAYQYACLRNLCYKEGYRVEMLSSFEPQFRFFYKWWIQLFAESEGKDNKGVFPVAGEFSEELHSVGQFIQDGSPIMFETFLDVKKQNASLIVEPDEKEDYFDYLDGKDFWEINKAAYHATVAAHSKKLPCLTIEVDELDAYHFGQLFYFFQFACYLSCKIMGVNPFDQPGVEAYKKWMFEALEK